MINITLFNKPGATSTIQDTRTISFTNTLLDIKALNRHQSERAKQPRFWTFSTWNTNPTTSCHIDATAVVLEYSKEAKHQLINNLAVLDYKSVMIETKMGFAVIFPLAEPINFRLYHRYAAVFAELVGVHGLLNGCISATYMICPVDKASIGEFGTVLPDSNFHHDTTDLSEDIRTWVNKSAVAKAVIPTEQMAKSTIPTRFDFSDMFDKIDGHINSIEQTTAVLREAIDSAKQAAKRGGMYE